MQETRAAVLDALSRGPVSGPELADQLGCSRTAVWNHVEALRKAGFGIESSGEGYVLASVPAFGGPAVEYGLDASYEIEYHDSIPSTNARARERAETGDTDVVVLADEQTGGRGRLDREWASPSGGIWCSVLVRPTLPPAQAPIVTLAAAVAVVEAVETVGVQAGIKWPNDVLVATDDGERKLAGILTEMAGEHDRVDWVVVGIGLNANVDPESLPEGATSLRALVGDVDRRKVTQTLLERLATALDDPESVLPDWRAHSLTLGQKVRIETATETIVGEAQDVTFPGTLVVETDSGRRTVTAGDCEHLRSVDG
jgi:BirA family biotin operon repressor/biotin-[acetyl-CoA-carboxylase] ligase